MITSYIALGSNLKTPTRQLHLGIAAIRNIPNTCVLAVAPFYLNKAIGRKAQPNYCNTVVKIRTSLTPHQLLAQCQRIEKKQGRVRRVKWGARTLDLDIILYGTQRINTPTLTIPHPRLSERDFVYIPLSQIIVHT